MEFASRIAKELNLRAENVKNTLELFNDGCTIPFISRYRKERTGGMNEVEIGEIDKLYKELQEIEKRREAIIKQIESQDKLTPELLKRINDAQTMTELEDLYLPYKPKRQTKAEKARAMGLEPLAKMIMAQSSNAMLETLAAKFGDDVEASISGAKDIIVEWISEDVRVRNRVRTSFRRGAVITSKVDKKKKDEPDAIKYKDYFDNSEPLSRCSSHRLLAMRRGEREGFLKVRVECEDERCLESIEDLFVKGNFSESNELVGEAVKSAYKDYVTPAIETEFANLSKEKADELGIKPIGFINGFTAVGVDPKIMGIGPVPATQKVMAKAGYKISDFDIIEANEAFAAQSIAVGRDLGIDVDKQLNPNGGAIALGHPVGASGARILVTLLHEMKKKGAKKGLATLCIGGGMGCATIVEKYEA